MVGERFPPLPTAVIGVNATITWAQKPSRQKPALQNPGAQKPVFISRTSHVLRATAIRLKRYTSNLSDVSAGGSAIGRLCVAPEISD